MLPHTDTKGYVQVAGTRETTPVRIYYEIHGSGPRRVLLIMGLGTSSSAWENQVKYLLREGDYSILILDNRGVGRSDSPKGLYTTSTMAIDTLEVLQFLDWTHAIHVVGISMGGMISLELASCAPDGLIASLCLTATHAGLTIPPISGSIGMLRSMFSKDIQSRMEIIAGVIYTDEWLDSPCIADSPHNTNREEAVHGLKQRFIETPIQPFAGSMGQMAAVFRHHIGKARLLRIRDAPFPILVVTGTIDNLIRSSNSKYLAATLQARLVVYEGCGHALPHQERDRYNTLLSEFFAESTKQI